MCIRRCRSAGVSSYPRDNNGSGFSPVGVAALMDALRLVDCHSGGGETPGQPGAVFNAIAAICAGCCNHLLVYRAVYEASPRKGGNFANALFRGAERGRRGRKRARRKGKPLDQARAASLSGSNVRTLRRDGPHRLKQSA